MAVMDNNDNVQQAPDFPAENDDDAESNPDADAVQVAQVGPEPAPAGEDVMEHDENTGVNIMEHDENTGVDVIEHDENTGVDTTGVENMEDGITTEAEALEQEMSTRYGPRSGKYNLRPRRTPGYTLANTGVIEDNLATPQMSMKMGLKAFGNAGVEAVKKEMMQLHDRKVIKPRKDLTPQQRREALSYFMFLKRKRCGSVKGRGCADGRPQRKYIAKEDASSPTIATESVFLTALIDAEEGREVAVVDIPGAFMQADMDEETFVKINGKMVDLLLEIDNDMYSPHVMTEHGETILYVELLKALYGTLRAARLFWEKLSKTLVEWGFEINPYDRCVANKMVNGKQLTVGWHVDDLKISHVDTTVVDNSSTIWIESLARKLR
jgi:hypothetical protein